MPVPEEQLHLVAGADMVSEFVYTTILSWISDGTLHAGEHIHDAEVADVLDVSPSTVRSALRRMRDLDIVDIEPNRYSRVADANPTAFVCSFTTCVALWKHGAVKALPGLSAVDQESFCSAMRNLQARIDYESTVNPISDPDFGANFVAAMRILVGQGENSIMVEAITKLEPSILHTARIGAHLFHLDKLKDGMRRLENGVRSMDVTEVLASLDLLDNNVSDYPDRFGRRK